MSAECLIHGCHLVGHEFSATGLTCPQCDRDGRIAELEAEVARLGGLSHAGDGVDPGQADPSVSSEVSEAEVERLRAALVDASELAEEGWAYAGEYFWQKWDARARLDALRTALGEQHV